MRKGAPCHGGMFRTPIMKSYRNSASEEFTSIEHLPTPGRETLAYKTMWKALPRTELTAFSEQATRDTFKNAVEKFTKNLYGKEGLTKGKFNDYSVKCMIDALLVNDTVNRNVISTWPMQCPAYKSQLPKLFPGIKPAQFYKAACFMHRLIYAKHRFHLGDSLAQLCWIERGLT